MLFKTAAQVLAVLATLGVYNDASPIGFHLSPLAILVTLLLALLFYVLGADRNDV